MGSLHCCCSLLFQVLSVGKTQIHGLVWRQQQHHCPSMVSVIYILLYTWGTTGHPGLEGTHRISDPTAQQSHSVPGRAVQGSCSSGSPATTSFQGAVESKDKPFLTSTQIEMKFNKILLGKLPALHPSPPSDTEGFVSFPHAQGSAHSLSAARPTRAAVPEHNQTKN